MNYSATYMIDSFERQKNTRASLITAGIAGSMILLFILMKWPLPKIEITPQQDFIEVNLDIPEDVVKGGGGGGGNPVQAIGEKGTAYSPPQPTTNEDAKDVAEDKDESSPAILKPDKPKPTATKVNENKSVVKINPKPVVATPAPPKPKAVVGKTLTGSGTGGGTADNYDRSGGSGTGNGVGTGPGYGGGSGGGNGGGHGTGTGTGTGPKRISGNRVVINPKNMNAGENLKGKVLAEIKVSADGIGLFVRPVRGSTYTSGPAIDIIRDWLRQNRFNKTGEESLVVYEFSFLLGG